MYRLINYDMYITYIHYQYKYGPIVYNCLYDNKLMFIPSYRLYN